MSQTTHVSAPAQPNPTADAKPSPDPTSIANDLLKEEHKQRRQEIDNHRGRLEGDNRNGLILTGAVWSWLAANQSALAALGLFEKVVVYLPAALMVFFFYRWHVMHKSIFVNADYLRGLESKAGLGPPAEPQAGEPPVLPLGWESWLQVKRREVPSIASLAHAGRVFWIGLIVVNLLLAVFFAFSRGWFGV